MVRTSCLAAIDGEKVKLLSGVLLKAGAGAPAITARLNVSELGRLAPSVLVCDLDALTIDPLELLRQIRFVLPECVIAVYTGIMTHAWSLGCHLAGANCLLAKKSLKSELSAGLRDALEDGCFTDPRFAAATD